MCRQLSGLIRCTTVVCVAMVSAVVGDGRAATRYVGAMQTYETRTAEFEVKDVALVGSETPGFAEKVRTALPTWHAEAFSLKPLLAVFHNRSAETVVGYAVSFKLVRADGTWEKNIVQFHYPDAVLSSSATGTQIPRGREVRSGESRVIGLSFEIDPASDNRWVLTYGKEQRDQALREAMAVEVGLDAVLFSDGVFIGPNESGIDAEFLAYVSAKRDIYQQALDAIDRGATVADAFEKLQAPRPRDAREHVSGNITNAVGEARHLRRSIGDAEIGQVLRNAVQSKPFVIRKR